MSRNIRKLKLKVDTTPNHIHHDLKDKVQHNPINKFNISSDVLPGHTHGNITASDVLPVGKLKNEKESVEKLKNEKDSEEKLHSLIEPKITNKILYET